MGLVDTICTTEYQKEGQILKNKTSTLIEAWPHSQAAEFFTHHRNTPVVIDKAVAFLNIRGFEERAYEALLCAGATYVTIERLVNQLRFDSRPIPVLKQYGIAAVPLLWAAPKSGSAHDKTVNLIKKLTETDYDNGLIWHMHAYHNAIASKEFTDALRIAEQLQRKDSTIADQLDPPPNFIAATTEVIQTRRVMQFIYQARVGLRKQLRGSWLSANRVTRLALVEIYRLD